MVYQTSYCILVLGLPLQECTVFQQKQVQQGHMSHISLNFFDLRPSAMYPLSCCTDYLLGCATDCRVWTSQPS